MLRGLPALSSAHLREVLRSRTALFWTLLMPIAYIAIAYSIFGKGEPDAVRALIPAALTLTLLSGTLFSVTFRMVTDRQNGLLRRYRATPVSALTVVLAHGSTSLVTLALSFVLQLAGTVVVWHVRPAGSYAGTLLVLLLGMLAFIPIGLFVGSVARDNRTAPALTHVIFFPMLLLTGATIPFHGLPDWLQVIGRMLPATYFVEAMSAVAVRGEAVATVAGPLLVLLLTAIVGCAVNALAFRWESTEPVKPRNLVLALGALVLLYAVTALLAPPLRLSEPPAPSAAGTTAAASMAAEPR